jgi:thioredoxin-related protein
LADGLYILAIFDKNEQGMRKLRILFLILLLPACTYSLPETLLIFTGSDWCPNCRRLDKKILTDSAFINFTKDRLIIEFADFPQHKKMDGNAIERNKALAEKYHFQGVYPTILLLDAAGNIKGQIYYRNQTPKEFIDQIKVILKQ